MKKARLSVYLEKPVLDALGSYAARRNQSLSLIAEAAIAAFLDPDQNGQSIVRKLNRLDRQMLRLERDQQISIEAFMLFVWSWLKATPQLPDSDGPAVRAEVTSRYDAFMEALGQRLASGGVSDKTLAKVMTDVSVSE